MMYNGGMNGPPYSMPPGGMMNDQYAQNTLPSASNLQSGPVHQPGSHFIPISGLPGQPENSFHHPNMIPNQPPPNHPYQQK